MLVFSWQRNYCLIFFWWDFMQEHSIPITITMQQCLKHFGGEHLGPGFYRSWSILSLNLLCDLEWVIFLSFHYLPCKMKEINNAISNCQVLWFHCLIYIIEFFEKKNAEYKTSEVLWPNAIYCKTMFLTGLHEIVCLKHLAHSILNKY